ncbi:uncharacterized protein LOC102229687 isoform X2 [Xiphophorus maculatus]|uniref:uncharacterized protein LOC102229687 isoform X2 n=1 Tax=Xiphophorus maculatus TaxID=8083 RepID=UPI000C6DDABC|nr:uncharacterized protein LOC102229687 isoform X2 [Xiphophorus maculatus]
MTEMMKVETHEPGGLSLEPLLPAATVSELEEETQDSKDLIHQILVIKKVPQDWSSNVDKQDPERPLVKKEEEELWIRQEEEQLTVKTEDEEKPQLSELHQIKTEDNGDTEAPSSNLVKQIETELEEDDCRTPEPNRGPVPVCFSQQR